MLDQGCVGMRWVEVWYGMVVNGMESVMRVLTMGLEKDVEVMRRQWRGKRRVIDAVMLCRYAGDRDWDWRWRHDRCREVWNRAG